MEYAFAIISPRDWFAAHPRAHFRRARIVLLDVDGVEISRAVPARAKSVLRRWPKSPM